MDLVAHLRTFLQQQPATSRYLLGYSGGLDSQVLLHALSGLGLNLAAVHVHHGLSSHADHWAEQCRLECQRLQIPCTVARVTLPAEGGLEAAARKARYEALAEHLREGEILLTAHHQDDQAETLLLMLLRGAGVAGLAAMPCLRPFAKGWLARPLLDVPRGVLEEYAHRHGLVWVEDESNFDTDLDRNFLRHEIFPGLRQHWPALSRVLARSAAHLAEAHELLEGLATADRLTLTGSRPHTLSVTGLQQLGEARRHNLLRYWLRGLGLPVPDSSGLQYLGTDVLGARADAAPALRLQGVEIRRYRDDLYAMPPLPAVPVDEIPWDPVQPLLLEDGRILQMETRTGQGLSAAKLAGRPITVSFRRGGERIRPVGRRHHHELKKLWQDAGVPPWERARVPLLWLDGDLLAVTGYWQSAEFAAGVDEKSLWCTLLPASAIASGSEKQDN